MSAIDTKTAFGASLFPKDAELATAAQNTVDGQYGLQNGTVSLVFEASPLTFAAGQYNGNTIYYNSTFSGLGDGYALLTVLHEMFHLSGLSDKQVEDGFKIDDSLRALGSASITNVLLGKCQ